jgi:hypothetical protein
MLEHEFGPTRWWRVVAEDGSLWCETSDEEEARAAMRPGDKLERLWTATINEWRDPDVDAASPFKDAVDELHYNLVRAERHTSQAMDVCYRLENPAKRSYWFRAALGRAQNILMSLYVRDLKMERRRG